MDVEYRLQQIRLDCCSKINNNRIKDIFEHLDTKKQGQITSKDIASIIYSSVPESDVDFIVRRFNRSKKNGKVTLPEFIL